MLGLVFPFIFYTDAWRVQFNHPKDMLFKILIAVGIKLVISSENQPIRGSIIVFEKPYIQKASVPIKL